MRRCFVVVILVALGCLATAAMSQSPYALESVELTGTERIDAATLSHLLDLKPGMVLDDEMVMRTRAQLLGLGLFRTALLRLQRGSRRGLARLVVEVEDDPSVLGSWALGGGAEPPARGAAAAQRQPQLDAQRL